MCHGTGSSTHVWTHKTIPCAPSPLCHFVGLIAGGCGWREGKKEEVRDMEERDGVRKTVCESLIISSLIVPFFPFVFASLSFYM